MISETETIFFSITDLKKNRYFLLQILEQPTSLRTIARLNRNWNEWNSNPGAIHDGGPPSW